jgi:hypothetical protein
MKYFDISSDLAVAATVLDPRFKMDYYIEAKNSNYDIIVENIIIDMGETAKQVNNINI